MIFLSQFNIYNCYEIVNKVVWIAIISCYEFMNMVKKGLGIFLTMRSNDIMCREKICTFLAQASPISERSECSIREAAEAVARIGIGS